MTIEPKDGGPLMVPITSIAPPRRVGKCLAAGDMDTLLPILASWGKGELIATKRELARYYEWVSRDLDEQYHALAKAPENLEPTRAEALDDAYQRRKRYVVETFAEIRQAIDFHLAKEEGATQ